MTTTNNSSTHAQESAAPLAQLSENLAQAVEWAQGSVVRVDDGMRMTASGVVWHVESNVAHIVATSHGVERDDEITIETHDGTQLPAKLVGRDHDTDIALLAVTLTEGKNLSAIAPAPDESVRVGSVVLALARPGDLGLHATMGIVSSRRDTQTAGVGEYILQTDATLFPGFSGGALVDVSGRIVGLLNRMFGRGMGVALGTPMVARVVENLMDASQSVRRGYLGLRMQLVNLPQAVAKEARQERGLLVIHVEPNGPAEAAGLMLGDTLISAGGTPLQDVDALRPHLRRAGEIITLAILRGGEMRNLSAKVGEQPV